MHTPFLSVVFMIVDFTPFILKTPENRFLFGKNILSYVFLFVNQ